ncbi:hypothetical protein A0H81_10842 [Grifola frondosa]|uniref:Uncharacterized protein n=1 Tax=Grifola frondosa TaxID=5627 RepID=A0A1C7LX25_GRIFR|nr:hypothetical protein A0H81_10842 [Grifola frondosa]
MVPEPGEKLGCVYRSLLPQRQYVPARCVTALRLPTIEFNMGGGTPDGYGVRMRDIVAMPKEVCIEDAENHVFSGTGRHALRLEISYEEWVRPIKLYTDDGPITRGVSAVLIPEF